MKTIYLDIDGVIADWNKAALNLIGLNDEDPELRKTLEKADYGLENVIPGFHEALDRVDRSGSEFWENLTLLPWANDLVNYLKLKAKSQQLIQDNTRGLSLMFVTSPGKWTGAGTGKMKWLEKHFPDLPYAICKDKYLLAAHDKLLIDDKPSAIRLFDKAGGTGFLWPNQYHIFSGHVTLFETIGSLEQYVSKLYH